MDPVDAILTESRKYPGDDRPVFIGQAASRRGDPTKPLTGRPGRKLAGLASMTPMEFYLSTVRVNLLPRYMGSRGRGDAFPMREARRNATRMAPLLDGRTVVFVGRKVADAFGCRKGWFDWDEGYFVTGDGTVHIHYAVVPHPSGLNRFWNDPYNAREASRFLSELMKKKSSVSRLRRVRERARRIDERRLGRKPV